MKNRMTLDALKKKLFMMGIVPVIKIEDKSKAVPLAEALCQGGLNSVEITFRTAQAAAAIQDIREAFPDMIIGAGTILSIPQVEEARKAGIDFIVTPGFNSKVVTYCLENKIPIIPGCSSPSDIEKALEIGISLVKFFPAKPLGGINAIKAIAAPYTQISFMPTGGISLENMNEYLDFDRVIACGGSWIAPEDLIQTENYRQIKENAQIAIRTMLGYRLKRIDMCCEKHEAESSAFGFISDYLGSNYQNASVSLSLPEESSYRFSQRVTGTIVIGVNSIERAINHLKKNGIGIDQKSLIRKANGKIQTVCLSQQINGFMICLELN